MLFARVFSIALQSIARLQFVEGMAFLISAVYVLKLCLFTWGTYFHVGAFKWEVAFYWPFNRESTQIHNHTVCHITMSDLLWLLLASKLRPDC